MSALEEIIGESVSESNQLRFVTAKIESPNFGLSKTTFEHLIVHADEIVFNSWNSNWSLSFEYFIPLLQAVQNTIQSCLWVQKRPRIIFISSVCAIGEWPRNHPFEGQIPEEVPLDRTNAMANGYGESKCSAEILLANAATVFMMPVAIVRVGQIGGPSSHGTRRWPKQGWIQYVIKASKNTGYWPSHVQPLDWIPVDSLAEGITGITKTAPTAKTLQVYNMVHPTPVSWNLLLATLKARFGLAVTEVSLPEWLAHYEPESFKLYSFFRQMGHGREYDMHFDTTNASTVLPKMPPLTMDQLELWFRSWDLRLDIMAKM